MDPGPGLTRDWSSGIQGLPAWHKVFRVGLVGLYHRTVDGDSTDAAAAAHHLPQDQTLSIDWDVTISRTCTTMLSTVEVPGLHRAVSMTPVM